MNHVILLLLAIPLFFMNGCAGMQGVADDVEKIADNDAIIVKVDKDSFQKDTDVDVEVHIQNKDINQVQP